MALTQGNIYELMLRQRSAVTCLKQLDMALKYGKTVKTPAAQAGLFREDILGEDVLGVR